MKNIKTFEKFELKNPFSKKVEPVLTDDEKLQINKKKYPYLYQPKGEEYLVDKIINKINNSEEKYNITKSGNYNDNDVSYRIVFNDNFSVELRILVSCSDFDGYDVYIISNNNRKKLSISWAKADELYKFIKQFINNKETINYKDPKSDFEKFIDEK